MSLHSTSGTHGHYAEDMFRKYGLDPLSLPELPNGETWIGDGELPKPQIRSAGPQIKKVDVGHLVTLTRKGDAGSRAYNHLMTALLVHYKSGDKGVMAVSPYIAQMTARPLSNRTRGSEVYSNWDTTPTGNRVDVRLNNLLVLLLHLIICSTECGHFRRYGTSGSLSDTIRIETRARNYVVRCDLLRRTFLSRFAPANHNDFSIIL